MNQEKILILDDQQVIRHSLADELRGWGYTRVETASAAEAIASFDHSTAAVVLLNVDMLNLVCKELFFRSHIDYKNIASSPIPKRRFCEFPFPPAPTLSS